VLLEGAPDNVTPQEIERHLLAAVPGVAAVSHIHVWLITSGRALATLHVRPAAGADARAVVRAVEHALEERFAIGHATVAIDWADETGEGACNLLRGREDDHNHGVAGGGA